MSIKLKLNVKYIDLKVLMNWVFPSPLFWTTRTLKKVWSHSEIETLTLRSLQIKYQFIISIIAKNNTNILGMAPHFKFPENNLSLFESNSSVNTPK